MVENATNKLRESVEQAQEILADYASEGAQEAEKVVDELSEILAAAAIVEAVRQAHGDEHGDRLKDILQNLFDSQINVEVEPFFGSGWTVRMGDDKNGFKAEHTFEGHGALSYVASPPGYIHDMHGGGRPGLPDGNFEGLLDDAGRGWSPSGWWHLQNTARLCDVSQP